MSQAEKLERLAALKKRLNNWDPFSLQWNQIARQIWALEDTPTIENPDLKPAELYKVGFQAT